MVPPGAEMPRPSRTVDEPKLSSKETFLFDKNYLLYEDGEGVLSEFVLDSVKESERLEMQNQAEESAASTDESVETNEEAQLTTGIEENEVQEFVDNRTEEEKLEERFGWQIRVLRAFFLRVEARME